MDEKKGGKRGLGGRNGDLMKETSLSYLLDPDHCCLATHPISANQQALPEQPKPL
jgi:hypothetical protein